MALFDLATMLKCKVSQLCRLYAIVTDTSQVLLQAMKEEPPLEAKCRDKFLVQTVRVDEVDEANVAAIWSNVEKTDKTLIQDKKIKVTFLTAAGTAGSPGLSNGATQDEPPLYASATPQYGSPAPATIADTDVRTPQSRSMYSAVTNDHPTSTPTARTTGADPHGNPQASGILAGVTNLVPTSQQDLQDQLAAAQSKIKELTNQLSDPQVRQRKVAEAQEKVATVVQQAQDTGVPLHITAGLCLISFLIAWLFF